MSSDTAKKIFLGIVAAYFVGYAFMLVLGVEMVLSNSDVVEVFGMALAVVPFAIGINKMQAKDRLPWLFFLATEIFLFIGEGAWAVYTHILETSPGNLSWCDAFYIASTTSCIIGIFAFMRKIRMENIGQFSADLFVTLTAVAGLICVFLVFPTLKDVSEVTFEVVLQVAYPVFDFGILFGCLVMFFCGGRSKVPDSVLLMMVISFIIVFLVDQANLYFNFYELDYTKYIGPLWPLAYCVLGYSCWKYSDDHDGAEKLSPRHDLILEIARMSVPYLVTFSGLIVVMVRYELYNFTFLWSMFLLVVLSSRQFAILMRNRKLNKELRRLNRKAVKESQMDFLTKLSNRRHVDETLAQIRDDDDGKPLGILFIDVDFFKSVNDTWGHETGDMALVRVADVIRRSIRDSDLGGRFGGDEFIVLLPNSDADAVSIVGQRIADGVAHDEKLAEIHVTLSIGGASRMSGDADAAINLADLALYAAKEGGRNQMLVVNKTFFPPAEIYSNSNGYSAETA